MVADVLQVAGVACLVAAAFMVTVVAGVAVLGAGLLAVGFLVER